MILYIKGCFVVLTSVSLIGLKLKWQWQKKWKECHSAPTPLHLCLLQVLIRYSQAARVLVKFISLVVSLSARFRPHPFILISPCLLQKVAAACSRPAVRHRTPVRQHFTTDTSNTLVLEAVSTSLDWEHDLYPLLSIERLQLAVTFGISFGTCSHVALHHAPPLPQCLLGVIQSFLALHAQAAASDDLPSSTKLDPYFVALYKAGFCLQAVRLIPYTSKRLFHVLLIFRCCFSQFNAPHPPSYLPLFSHSTSSFPMSSCFCLRFCSVDAVARKRLLWKYEVVCCKTGVEYCRSAKSSSQEG